MIRSSGSRTSPRNAASTLLAALTVALLPAGAGAQSTAAVGAAAAADPADVASPDAIVEAMYESVNRPPGESYDWDRLRTLSLPSAIMIPSIEQTGGEFRVLSVEEFTDWIDEITVVGGPDDAGFREEQIAYRVERYGDIAQVFSTYQKRAWNESEVLGRGINSIQLVQNDGRWWVASVVWDEEVGAGPIPERYMPR
ncbi:MAG: hypothetical protein ACOC8B_03860 [Gemmatimonadota bacterium]